MNWGHLPSQRQPLPPPPSVAPVRRRSNQPLLQSLFNHSLETSSAPASLSTELPPRPLTWVKQRATKLSWSMRNSVPLPLDRAVRGRPEAQAALPELANRPRRREVAVPTNLFPPPPPSCSPYISFSLALGSTPSGMHLSENFCWKTMFRGVCKRRALGEKENRGRNVASQRIQERDFSGVVLYDLSDPECKL